ncbi:MAG: amino acid adenylation domain-containing protein [Flammeovirgaceae bacterium]
MRELILRKIEKLAQETPEQIAFKFIAGKKEHHLTYQQIVEKAKQLAVVLHEREATHERVVLYFSNDPNFIISLLACFFSGAIAVPLKQPNPKHFHQKFDKIKETCQPKLVLCDQKFFNRINQNSKTQSGCEWINVEALAFNEKAKYDQYNTVHNAPEIAYLQFTSGSTSFPKGVIIEFTQLHFAVQDLANGWPLNDKSVTVSWLPFYHDMGLVFGVLFPLLNGVMGIISTPTGFISSPLSWLETISTYQATHTCAPNFAFDACTKAQAKSPKQLDLSSLKLLMNGAEFIQAQTLTAFFETFNAYGLKKTMFCPGYGMAEATLKITALPTEDSYISLQLDRDEFEKNRIQIVQREESKPTIEVIGCGWSGIDAEIVIVDPQSATPVAPNQIGEIWVHSKSVGSGYWGNEQQTQQTFRNALPTTDKLFLRTGDLGFIHQDQLFITGRIKELIIINGRNIYPQDIEVLAAAAHQDCYMNAGAAFFISEGGAEKVVVVQEVKNHGNHKQRYQLIAESIRENLFDALEVNPVDVVLVRKAQVSKTSSGKIQRLTNKGRYLNKQLNQLYSLKDDQVKSTDNQSIETNKSLRKLQNWLIAWVSDNSGIGTKEVSTTKSFAHYHLGSLEMVKLAVDLEKHLNRKLPTTIGFDYPNIQAISNHLLGFPIGEQASPKREKEKPPRSESNDIAVIGMACRFPQASSLEAFWELLHKGIDTVSEIPLSRWDNTAYYHQNPEKPNKTYSKNGAFLEDIDLFDHEFFQLSPAEATHLDPRQRLLLEVCWHSLQDARLRPDQLHESTGTFIGISDQQEYLEKIIANGHIDNSYIATGNAASMASGRLASALNINGPCLSIDTACSSSLVALHLACSNLLSGECDTAITGGVQLMLQPEPSVILSRMNLLSPDGRCKSFDDAANGYVRGEGCGIVILKRLDDAIAENLPIKAVIKGSAINHDGKSQSLTAPNFTAQCKVITKALAEAQVKPQSINFVEAHGSGTMLGDSIEVNALHQVYRKNLQHDVVDSLYIGSVKSNIGHLEAAAGIAGFIKTVLCLQHQVMPKSLHCKVPNTNIQWSDTPVRVLQEARNWKQMNHTQPRRAGVSSFGFSGTNAHIILEEYRHSNKKTEHKTTSRSSHLLKLSAVSPKALQLQLEEWCSFVKHTTHAPQDMTYAANTGMAEYAYRLAIPFANKQQLQAQLEKWAKSNINKLANNHIQFNGLRPNVAFLFTGQGAQYHQMAKQLYETNAQFKSTFDQCAQLIQHYAPTIDIKAILFDQVERVNINDTYLAQPALFSIGYSLAKLWVHWGISPNFVAGHSLGEITAACFAEYLSLEDAIQFVVKRGALMQSTPQQGAMLVVECNRKQVLPYLLKYENKVSLAAENRTTQVVLSGYKEEIFAIETELKAAGFQTDLLKVSHAFHSPLMEGIKEEIQQVVQNIKWKAGKYPLVSNLNGQLVGIKTLSQPVYWWKHLRETVKFKACLETLKEHHTSVYLELGPHPVLTSMALASHPDGVHCFSLHRKQTNWHALLNNLGQLFCAGYPISWENVEKEYGSRQVSLPKYVFNKQRFWIATPTHAPARAEIAQEQNASQTVNMLHWWDETPISIQRQQIESFLMEEISDLLQYQITKNQCAENLMKYGLDSLMLVRLKNRFSLQFEKNVPLKGFLANPTINALSKYLVGQHQTAETQLPAPLPVREEFPLSFAQKRLYFLQKLSPLSPAWNQTCRLNIQGKLDRTKLALSLQLLQERHELLRVKLKEVARGQTQVLVHDQLRLEYVDFRPYHPAIQEGMIQLETLKQARTVFDLTTELPLRAFLYQLEDHHYHLVIVYHHSIADGWTLVNILLKELALLYVDQKNQLPELTHSYRDFIEWQQQTVLHRAHELKSYWKQVLQNFPTPPTFYSQHITAASDEAYQGEKVHLIVGTHLSKSIDVFSKEQGITPFSLWMGLLYVVLSKISNQYDLIIGIPVSNRVNEAFEYLFGDFTNFLPLRIQQSAFTTFKELLEYIHKERNEAIAHADYPFEQIVADVCHERELEGTQLFNVAFAMHNYLHDLSHDWGSELDVQFIDPVAQFDNGTSELDLIFEVARTEKGWVIECEFDKQRFERNTVVKLLETYERVMALVIAQPALEIYKIPLLDSNEQQHFLQSLHTSQTINQQAYDTVHERFAEVATNYTEKIALRYGDQQITYGELAKKSDQLAVHLCELGVQVETKVGIFMDRSIELIIAMLGIWKAGACFVPLDTKHPDNRLLFQLSESDSQLLLTQQHLTNRLSAYEGYRLKIDTLKWESNVPPPKRIYYPDALAYIIFTSGSTGKSKGVEVSHRNVMRLFDQTQSLFDFNAADVWSMFHSQAFDFSVWEIWGALLTGGTLAIVPSEVAQSPEDFYHFMVQHQVTVLNQTPVAFKSLFQFAQEKDSAPLVALRWIIFGGDALDMSLIEKWFMHFSQLQTRLVNMYGITETTVHVTFKELTLQEAKQWQISPIGTGIPDLFLMVLDEQLQPLPNDVPGELYVGGGGVSRGYTHQPSLTAERFIPNPFSTTVPGTRIYKTGDIVVQRSTGELEYIKRADHQVKIRGFRIELGEIKQTILQHEYVNDAHIQCLKEGEEQYITAYIKPNQLIQHVEQTSLWQSVFDQTYLNTDTQRHENQFIGWNNSYTGKAIPNHEMEDWVADTCAKIKALNPRRVLEIGCGKGLILLPISELCDFYYGIDISGEAIDYLSEKVGNNPKIKLEKRPAHDITAIDETNFDVIIFNSVVQFFPNLDYLENILPAIFAKLTDTGSIFLGDIRDFRLIQEFHADVLAHRINENELVHKHQINTQIQEEEELLIDPAFFDQLPHRFPEINRVELQLKTSAHNNEMSLFRYDVTLTKGTSTVQNANLTGVEYHWGNDITSVAQLPQYLSDAYDWICIRQIPNRRVARGNALFKKLEQTHECFSSELKKLIQQDFPNHIEPNTLLAINQHFNAKLLVSNDPLSFDILFYQKDVHPQSIPSVILDNSPRGHANLPAKGFAYRQIRIALQDYLKAQLPYYMQPAYWVFLEQFPLTVNGKIDQKNLPKPNRTVIHTNEGAYVAPTSPIQEILVEIWESVLGVNQVSVTDNFFEVGGHSLLAANVLSHIRETFQLEMPLRLMLECQTIEEQEDAIVKALSEVMTKEALI